ncbi:unnamed protein product [Cylindrotheca closterium]|uniref:Uncharacterized protein n=1 Tax=Cylindrotheca closterium TaxID=2856 RepID=A0AAD2JJY8_9STRA|nr:unnamed protein product [Cylindrotheca closterium]
MPMPLPTDPFKAHQRVDWDAATPFVSDAFPLLSAPPPPRMRPRPNPSDIVECRPTDIERLSLPVLTMDDQPIGPSETPPLTLKILPRRSRPYSEFSRRRGVCGKRTRTTDEKRYEESIFKSATLQYSGISGKTIYADPVVTSKEMTGDIKSSSFGSKTGSDEDSFYVPTPRFTLTTRSALPHVLRLSD